MNDVSMQLTSEQVKSFKTSKEAEEFVKNGVASSGSVKYYAVRSGKVPGIYTDWPSAQAQVIGASRPRYKSFPTHAEAQAWMNEVGADSNGGLKAPSKSKKGKDDPSVLGMLDALAEPGCGLLPPGTEDNFDRGIKLNHDTGLLEYKAEGELNAVKMQATGLSKDASICIYTDGSALKNGASGARAGVGVWFGPSDSRNVSEPLKGPRQTNQRAELTACKRAIEIAPRDRDVIVYTDSKYAIACVTEWFINWRKNDWMTKDKKPVENKDLIEPILQRIAERELMRANTTWRWVKGHADDPGNVAADRLAVHGAREGAFIGEDT